MPATADLVQELVTVGGFDDIMDKASLIYGFVRDELTRNDALDDFIQMKRLQRGYFELLSYEIVFDCPQGISESLHRDIFSLRSPKPPKALREAL